LQDTAGVTIRPEFSHKTHLKSLSQKNPANNSCEAFENDFSGETDDEESEFDDMVDHLHDVCGYSRRDARTHLIEADGRLLVALKSLQIKHSEPKISITGESSGP